MNRKSISIVILLGLLLPSLLSCTNIPGALKLSDVIYEDEISHWVGPAGLNRSITVFKLPKKILENIQTDQINYLNSLPHTISEKLERALYRMMLACFEMLRANKNSHSFPTSEPIPPFFSNWHQTPIEDISLWYLRSRPKDKPISVNSFYEDHDFVALIPRQLKDEIAQAITSVDSFYSFSAERTGYVIVISPRWEKAYVLTRS